MPRKPPTYSAHHYPQGNDKCLIDGGADVELIAQATAPIAEIPLKDGRKLLVRRWDTSCAHDELVSVKIEAQVVIPNPTNCPKCGATLPVIDSAARCRHCDITLT